MHICVTNILLPAVLEKLRCTHLSPPIYKGIIGGLKCAQQGVPETLTCQLMNIKYIFIILLLISGCARQGGSEADSALVKGTVNRYVTLLAQGYQKLNMTLLQEVSTKKRATKVYYHMAALGEGKARMISHITSLQFTDIHIVAVDKADVKTSEKWDYAYENVDSGKEMLNNSISYKLNYRLVKKNGRWLVDDIDILESKPKNSKSLPFMQRPVPLIK